MLDFQDIQHYATELKTRYAARDQMLEALRMMIHMEWQEQPRADWIKATMSPTAYNAVLGAKRLLTTVEPQFSIPFDETSTGAKDVADKIEKAAKRMWNGSGRVAQMPVHHEMMLSAIYAGEICGTVIKSADRIKHIEGMMDQTGAPKGLTGSLRRWRSIAAETPYLFRVWDPRTCYSEFDGFGLRAMLRVVKMRWGEVLDTWGEKAQECYPGVHDRWEEVTINDWYDWEVRCYWVEGGSHPIYCEDHGLEFIPIVSQISEGTFLFDRPELQRFPLLYGIYKSGLWKRENLALTVLFSQIFALGSTPLLIHQTQTPGEPLKMVREGPLSMLEIGPGETISPMGEKVVDASIMQALSLAQQLDEHSSISKATLGIAPDNTRVYSAISLLAQQGRLPLVSPKELGGAAIANFALMALRWMRADGDVIQYHWRGRKYELSPADFPDDLVMDCKLEVDLPQDKLQMLNAAQVAVASRLASRRWARETIVGIGQSDAMEKEIWSESRQDFEIQRVLEKIKAGDQITIQQMAAAMQQQMQQQQAIQMQAMQAQQAQQSGQAQQAQAGQAQPGQPRGEAPGGMSPEQAEALAMGQSMGPTGAYPPGGQVGPGAPLQGPLPPRGQ